MKNTALFVILSIFLLITLSGCQHLDPDASLFSFVEDVNDSIWFDNLDTSGTLQAAYDFRRGNEITVYLFNSSENDLCVNMTEGTYCYALKYKTKHDEIAYFMSPLLIGSNSMANLVVLRKLPNAATCMSIDCVNSTSFSIKKPDDCVAIMALSVAVKCLEIQDVHIKSADELQQKFCSNEKKVLAQKVNWGDKK